MSTTNLLEAVRIVKENERFSEEFYDQATKETGSQLGKDLFQQLCQFEKFHYDRLAELEKSLMEKNDYIKYEGREFPMPPKLGPEPVEEPHHQTVINIIDKALELEKKSEKAYSDLAAEIPDQQGHAMFRRLAEEEHNHYRILTEAYWTLSNLKVWKWSPA
jgi:rubrerythrin